MTPIEAFSVRKTVVGTAVDGTIEEIKDDFNGYLVPIKRPDMLAQKINKCIASNLTNMESNAYTCFLRDFSFKRFKTDLIEYYKQL